MTREDTIQEVIERLARLQRPAEHGAWNVLGQSHAQVGMMYMLFYHKDASMKQIASYLDVTQSAVTQLIEPLLTRGMVERRTDLKDRRVARLGLTSKGLGVLKKFKKLKTEGLRTALNSLADADLDNLAVLTRKMAAGSKTTEIKLKDRG